MTIKVSFPFQISQQDINYSDSLEQEDLGKWALIINGCYQFFESVEAASKTRCELLK